MTENTSLFRQIRHYLLSRVVLVALGFATFPLMTRMLTVSQYGVLSLTLRIVMLLTVLSKCGMQYSVTRFYDAHKAHSSQAARQEFYSTLVLGPLLTSLAMSAVYLPLVMACRDRLADPMLYRCLLFAPALMLLRALQSLLLGLLRNEGRSKLHGMLEVASKVLALGALAALLLAGWHSAVDLLWAIAATEAAIVALQLWLLLRKKLLSVRAFDWALIRTSLAFGAPLIAYELSSVVLDSGDRLLVRHFLGDTSLGYYSAAYNISGYLQDTVMTPLNLAIFPIYMRLWNEQGHEATQQFLSTVLSWFLVAALAITALSLLCSRDAIVLLASSRFVEAHRLLPILVPGLMLYATHIFLNVGLILEKRTILMSAMVLGAAVVNLTLNVVMIPRLGLTGAAWATLLSYALLIAALAIVNRKLIPVRFEVGLFAKAGVSAALSTVLAGQIHTHLPALTLVLRLPVALGVFVLALMLLSSSFRIVVAKAIRRPIHPLKPVSFRRETVTPSCSPTLEKGRP